VARRVDSRVVTLHDVVPHRRGQRVQRRVQEAQDGLAIGDALRVGDGDQARKDGGRAAGAVHLHGRRGGGVCCLRAPTALPCRCHSRG